MGDDKAGLVKIEVTFTKKEHEYLQRLVATGFYGLTPANAAERLVAEGIMRRIREDDLKLELKKE